MSKQNTNQVKAKPQLNLLDISQEFAQTCLKPDRIINYVDAPVSFKLLAERVKWAQEQ